METAAATRERHPERWLAFALVALAALPLIVAVLRTWGVAYYPAGDQAVIELRIRDVGAHTPLLGPYSRYGWNHPGPLLYYLLAVPYRLLGSSSNAVLAASAVLNLGCIAGIGLIAWRRGRAALVAITMVPIAIVMHYLLPTTFENPWNPFLTLLPVALFVLLAWTLIEGDRWAAPLMLFVGSFLVQSHVGYALVVAGISALALGWVTMRDRSPREDQPRWRRVILASAGMLVIVWLPVLFDEVAGTHNLTAVIEYFSTGERAPVGFGRALGFIAREVGNRAPWLGGVEPVDPGSGSVVTRELTALALPTVAFVAGAVAAWRTRARAALHLQVIVGATTVLLYLSLSRITDTVFDYLIKWSWVVAMLVWISIVWSLWSAAVRTPALRDRVARLKQPHRAHWVLPVAGLLALTFVGRNTLAADVRVPEQWAQHTMADFTGDVVTRAPTGGPIRIRAAGGFVNSQTDGLALQLERFGRNVIVEPWDTYKFGENRTTKVDAPTSTMWVVYADSIADFETKPELTQIARYDPLTATERDQFQRDDALLRQELTTLHRDDLLHSLATNDSLFLAQGLDGVDQDVLHRWETLRERDTPVAVFIGPPS